MDVLSVTPNERVPNGILLIRQFNCSASGAVIVLLSSLLFSCFHLDVIVKKNSNANCKNLNGMKTFCNVLPSEDVAISTYFGTNQTNAGYNNSNCRRRRKNERSKTNHSKMHTLFDSKAFLVCTSRTIQAVLRYCLRSK